MSAGTPLTDAIAECHRVTWEDDDALLLHARRMETDRARLTECLRECVVKINEGVGTDYHDGIRSARDRAESLLRDLDASGEG